jgi:hypothetical protein
MVEYVRIVGKCSAPMYLATSTQRHAAQNVETDDSFAVYRTNSSVSLPRDFYLAVYLEHENRPCPPSVAKAAAAQAESERHAPARLQRGAIRS